MNNDLVATPLSNRCLTAFSLPALPLNMLLVAAVNYLPAFYAKEVGLSLYWIGLAFFIAVVLDSLIEVYVGRWSDASLGRIGRKQWMAAGVLPLMLAIYCLFSPAGDISGWYLIIWLSVFYGAWAIVQVPYMAWAADLSSDYQQRSRIFGYRETSTVIGGFVCALLPILFLDDSATMGDMLRLTAHCVLVLIPLAIVINFLLVQEQPHKACLAQSKGIIYALKINPLYRRFLLFFLLFQYGLYIFNVAIVFYIQNRLQLGNAFIELIIVAYATNVLGMPVCVKLSQLIERHIILVASIILTCITILLMTLLPAQSYWLTMVCFVLLGISSSAAWALPPAIIGDLNDKAVAGGAADQAGVYMAGYNLVFKMGMAVGMGVGMPLLQYAGFDPSIAVSAANDWALNLVGCFIPAAIMAASLGLLWRFPLQSHSISHSTPAALNQGGAL